MTEEVLRENAKTRFSDLKSVQITDAFYRIFLEKLRKVSAPDIFGKFETGGVMNNYARVRRGETGGHAGAPWFNALICETIRGVSDLISVEYSADLDATMDAWIAAIADAQAPDGWLHPYDTLECPNRVWGLNGGNALYQHETYNCGCMIEAGVHHYRATGKTSMLACSVKIANYLTDHIGEPPKWNIACEHSIAELAMLSLEDLCADAPDVLCKLGARPGEYLRLVRFWYANKGNHENRHQFPAFLREYAQDHRPAVQQREAVGHAVRGVLCYAGMAECALASGDGELADAAAAIWKDIAETKVQINGSVGVRADDERYGAQYELPNNAYLETCAGAGLLFFAAAMFRLTGEAPVWDVAESVLQNLLPAAVSADGTHYTYRNPLESDGTFQRWSWNGCPCCPPMLLKAAGEMPAYIFAMRGDTVWLNLYIDAAADLPGVGLNLETAAYGKRLTVRASRPVTLAIRVPGWARAFGLNRPYRMEKGYALVQIPAGACAVEIRYTAPPVKIEAHPLARAIAGTVAVRKGPVLYCLESRNEDELNAELSADPPEENADGTVTVRTQNGGALRLTEYRDWNNHGAMPMRVWFRQAGPAPADLSGWAGKLYRVYSPKQSG